VTAPASVVCADERASATDGALRVDIDRWAAFAEAVLDAEGAAGELTVTFVDVAEIAELNAEHMGKRGPTDVLSFPLDDGEPVPGVPALLGDVVICPEVASAQYADHAGTFDDEIALLVVHGILHVLGHDHAEPDEAEVMRARELELLEALHWRSAAPAGFRQTHD
jgi:probable rRNA maturation factor